MNRSDLKPSPACFPFNYEHNSMLLQIIDGIFVTHSVPEVNSIILLAKIA